jgi:Protein of unknown function (DUF6044)
MSVSDRKGAHVLYAGIALGLGAWLSLEYVALGPLSWMYGYGGTLETIPVHLALAKTSSTYALWAPFIAGGLDRLAFWGNADPFNVEPLLFWAFPVWLANGVHVLAQRVIAIYFAARVAEEQLEMPPRWSALTGVLHGGLSYFTVGDMLASPAVPLLLWLVPRLAALRRWASWTLIVGVGYSTFTSFTHTVPYLAVFAIAWFWCVAPGRRRLWAVLGVFFAAVTLADSPQLLAAVHNAAFSHRTALPTEPLDISLHGLVYYQPQFDYFDQDKALKALAVVLPWALTLAAAAMAWPRRHGDPSAARYLALVLVLGMLSFKPLLVLVQQAFALVIPWVSAVNMVRFHTLPAPFLAAAAVGMGAWVASKPWSPETLGRRVLVVSLIAYAGILTVWPKASLFYPLMIDGWGQKNYEVRALDELRRSETRPFRVASVLPLQPAYAYGHGLETADGWANMYPAVYRELWLEVLRPLLRNLPGNRDVFDPPNARPQDHYIFLGTGILVPTLGLLPGELPLRDGFDVDRRFNVDLLSMLNVKYLLSEYPLHGRDLRLWHAPAVPPSKARSRSHATGLYNDGGPTYDFWHVSLRRIRRDLRAALERLRSGKDVYVYENLAVLPRFRLVTRLETLPSPQDVLERAGSISAREMAFTAIAEALPGEATGAVRLAGGSVHLERYSPDQIELTVRPLGPSLLVIANTWNPFWTAAVGGSPRALRRVNHAQFGLALHEGDRNVVLTYRPPYAAATPMGWR